MNGERNWGSISSIPKITANWKGQFVKYKIISIVVSIKNFIFKETLRKSIHIISNLWV